MPANTCDERILRDQQDAQAGFQPKSADIDRGDPTYLPESDIEWGSKKPVPKSSDTILPEQGKQLTVSCEVQWTDFRIDVKVNLVDKVIESLQTLLDAGVGVASNENTAIQAVQQVTASLRSILEGSRREINQPWHFRFSSDQASPYVFATHNQTTTTYVKHVGVSGSSYDMHVHGETEVRLDTILIEDLKLTVSRTLAETQERVPKQRCKPVALSGNDHLVSINTRITLDFAGFRRTIEQLIADLTQIAQSLLSGGLLLQRLWEELQKLGSADDPVAEAERSLERFREELNRGLKEALQKIIHVLTQFRGHVIVNTSAISLKAITEPTFIAIDDRHRAQTAPAEPVPAEPTPREDLPLEEQLEEAEPTETQPGALRPLTPAARISFTIPKGGLREAVMVHYDQVFPNKSLVVVPVSLHRKSIKQQ